MKFFIDKVEIKTVLEGARIQGAINIASRTAHFSYIISEEFEGSLDYYAVAGSEVVIKNDDNKSVFYGFVARVEYIKEKHLVNIDAEDEVSKFLKKTFKGRLKGLPIQLLSKLTGGIKIFDAIKNLLKNEINIVILKKLTVYDVIKIIFNRFLKDEFKIYIDGAGRINVLLPFVDNSKGDFVIGRDVISASFMSEESKNVSKISAIGNDDVISGSVIRLVDSEREISGEFIVESDVHIYTKGHVMNLVIKERNLG